MAVIGLAIRLLSLLVMYKISNPKLLDLKDEEDPSTLNLKRFTSKKMIKEEEGGKAAPIAIEGPPASTEKIRITEP